MRNKMEDRKLRRIRVRRFNITMKTIKFRTVQILYIISHGVMASQS